MTFKEIWWQLLILAVCSYFIGNINFALIISKIKKKDIREQGSGNPGTLNMGRTFGLKIGLLTLFLDLMKGFIPSLVGYLIFKDKYLIGGSFISSATPKAFNIGDLSRIICGLSVVLGHIYPAFLKFKGGKGIASTIGVFMACNPLLALLMIIIAALYIAVFEYGSMASLIAISVLAIERGVHFYLKYTVKGYLAIPVLPTILFYLALFFICFFTWYAHRKNIVHLIKGDEHKTSIKEKIKKAQEKKRSRNAVIHEITSKETGEENNQN